MARATLTERLDPPLEAVARIGAPAAGRSIEDYTADGAMRDVVERSF